MTAKESPYSLGPALLGTLVSPRPEEVVAAYCDYLGASISEMGLISQQLALHWGAADLAAKRFWLLANPLGDIWLRVVEDPQAQVPEPLRHTGWLSLEISVAEVDQLAEQLAGSPFTILRPPADLDISDKIRAMQVSGPAGEVLYLTQIKGPVPPFEIVPARCSVDKLFIPVLCCHQRDQALELYEELTEHQGISFDTKITVVNQVYGVDIDRRHPVATLQLAGDTLIEIDQLEDAVPRPHVSQRLPSGIAMISFVCKNLPQAASSISSPVLIEDQFYRARRTLCLHGAAGELIELVEAN